MGEMPLWSGSVAKNTIEIQFSWPEVVLEVRSLPFSGTISQGIIPILVLSGLIDFLPYGAWQAVTHVSFQSFSNELVPSAITYNSQFSLWRENDQHVQIK